MGRAKKSANVRKFPLQDRSRATVDAIMQAATYILTRFGWDHLTTNAIADRAGVNISSLYQYFPNKQAIVAELQRRHAHQTRQELLAILDDVPTQPSLRSALTHLVESLVANHRVDPAIHRIFADELPQTVRCAISDEGDAPDHLLMALRPFMENVPDPVFAAHMVRLVAHAIIHDAASHHPKTLERSDFVPEVVTLLDGYLRRPAAIQAT